MSRRTILRCRAGAPIPSRRSLLRERPLLEPLEGRRLLSGGAVASGQVAWVPSTTSAVDAASASGADPGSGAIGSGSAGTGTSGPGTLVSPGNGTAVGRTINAAAGVAFSGEVGLL